MKQITPKKTLMTLMMSFVVLASSCEKHVQNENQKVADYSVTIIPETKSLTRSKSDMLGLVKLKEGVNVKSSEIDLKDKTIAVFPLTVNSEVTKLYAIVNYTDSTTAVTTEYTNYPTDILFYSEDMIVDSLSREIENIAPAFKMLLEEMVASVDYFSNDEDMINGSLIENSEPVFTKGYPMPGDDDFNPPAHLEIEFILAFDQIYAEKSPLTTTSWNQDFPYNAANPGGYAVGCVALAYGQLFKYHKHPRNMAHSSYVMYENMPNYDETLSDKESTAAYTAPMLYEIGRNINTSWGRESIASVVDAANLYVSKFYNVNIQNLGNSNISSSMVSIMKNNLLANKPFVMRGEDGTGEAGHAWIVDGFKQKQAYHQNRYTFYNPDGSIYSTFMRDDSQGVYSSIELRHNWGWYGRPPTWISTNASILSYNIRKIAVFCTPK